VTPRGGGYNFRPNSCGKQRFYDPGIIHNPNRNRHLIFALQRRVRSRLPLQQRVRNEPLSGEPPIEGTVSGTGSRFRPI